MFDDVPFYSIIAERMLDDFELTDILEMNDVLPVDALAILIEKGLIDVEEYEMGVIGDDD